ncbi:MAG TPA: hypothetical protein VJ725_06275 [Thermoanaerobaculia bacterium]|nr:hypothetical protein [Thermoanaerobaculia bacterium]
MGGTKVSTWTLSLFLLVLSGSSLPVLSQGDPEREPARQLEGVTPQELIVRQTYQRLQSFLRASGKDLRFRLSDFETLGAGQLSQVYWLDAVTMPGGTMVDVTRSVQQTRRNGVFQTASVRYLPSWSEGQETWEATDSGQKIQSMTVAEVLAAVAKKQSPEFHDVRAMTSFKVLVELEGKSRSYGAAFLWLPASDPSRYTFLVLDNVTQGVEEAAREILPAEGAIPKNLTGPSPYETDPGPTCRSWSDTTGPDYVMEGTDGHITGRHYSTASFRITCSCNGSCASTCTAQIPSASCSDDGFKDKCHKMASSMNASSAQNDNGKTSPASCAAGFGCVKKGCLFCACGLGVSVSISGVKVTFTPTENPEWSGNLQYSRTCGACS